MSQVLRRERLAAESAKHAFYELSLVEVEIGYLIEKRSGAQRETLDTDVWFKPTLSAATRFFERKLKQKTNPARQSPRKYHPVTDEEWTDSVGPSL